jgi:hypothetical protein
MSEILLVLGMRGEAEEVALEGLGSPGNQDRARLPSYLASKRLLTGLGCGRLWCRSGRMMMRGLRDACSLCVLLKSG